MKNIICFRWRFASQFLCPWLCSSCCWLKLFLLLHLQYHFLGNIFYSPWFWYPSRFGQQFVFSTFISGKLEYYRAYFVSQQFNIKYFQWNYFFIEFEKIYFLLSSPSTHKMSPILKKIFLQFMPKVMMMRRTQYTLPDYDDSTPSHGYTNEIDVRWVWIGSEFYEIEGKKCGVFSFCITTLYSDNWIS